MTTTTSRKVLLPFATLVAAGAVAIGSGATFTSESDSAITATTGILEHSNPDEVTLQIENLKPGGTAEGTLTITNVGSLNSTLKVIVSDADGIPGTPEVPAVDLADRLELTIEGETVGTDVLGYATGPFNGPFATAGYELGDLEAGLPAEDSITVTVTVTMLDSGTDSDNVYQDLSAGLDLKFVTTQTDAADDDESDVSGWDGV